MRIAAFSMPEGWEDWITLVIGVWLFASPWILQVDDSEAAGNCLLIGALVIIFELVNFYTLRVWEESFIIVLGAWLIVSSFAMSGFAVVANGVVCGVLLLTVSLYEMWDDRRQRASR
jgi:SPW repeat